MSATVFWLAVSLLGLVLTVYAEREAYKDAEAVRKLNGSIIGINVRGSLFQERIRAVVQIIFVVVGLMGLTGTATHLIVPLLLATPVLLAGNSVRGIVDRRKVIRKGHAEIAAERDRRMDRLEDQGALLETKLDENTRITQEASDNATAAYHEANDLNVKIASHGETLVIQGEAAAADRELGKDTNETAHRIDERVP